MEPSKSDYIRRCRSDIRSCVLSMKQHKLFMLYFINLIIFIAVLSYVNFENNKNMNIGLQDSGKYIAFPSTVMQSVAAIYGMFIAIFLLIMQYNRKKLNSIATVLKPQFEIISYIIVTVLCFNGLILFSLSYYNLIESKIKILLILSLVSLVLSLLAIVSFSFQMLPNTAGLKTPKEMLIQINSDEDKLKLYTEPLDTEGKYKYEIKKGIENIRYIFDKLADGNIPPDNTHLFESYMNSETYKEERIVESYIEILGTYENPIIRARTARLFGNIRIKKTVKLLIEKLNDYYAIVRQSSAEALGKIGDIRAVDPLIQTLLNDDDKGVRQSSAEALRKIRNMRTVEPLIQTLLGDSAKYVRQSSAEALSEFCKSYKSS